MALDANSTPARLAPHASFQPPLSFSAVRDLLVAVGVLAPNASTGRSACVRVRLRASAQTIGQPARDWGTSAGPPARQG